MADSVYEGMFILDAGRFGRDPEGVAGQIPKMIEGAGGEILVSRLWEERRLAYQIKGHRKGAYWLTYFRLPGTKLPEIQRKCRLSDSILRTLVLKVDPRIVDTLVEHAKAGHSAKAVGLPPVASKPGEGASKPGEGASKAGKEEQPGKDQQGEKKAAVAEQATADPAPAEGNAESAPAEGNSE